MPNSPPVNEADVHVVTDFATGGKERLPPSFQADEGSSESSKDKDGILDQEACEIASLKIRRVSGGSAKQESVQKKRYELASEVKTEGNALFDIREESFSHPNSLDDTGQVLENALVHKTVSQRLNSFESDESCESILSKLDRESSLNLSDDEGSSKRGSQEDSSADTNPHRKSGEGRKEGAGSGHGDVLEKNRSPSPAVDYKEHELDRSTSVTQPSALVSPPHLCFQIPTSLLQGRMSSTVKGARG
eukprot:751711-Hanusia_phi.AAC.5